MIFLLPLRLLDPIPEAFDPLTIVRARKRWLAQFALNSADTITVGGQSLDRNQITQVLELLTAESYPHYQTLLGADKLLLFLENGNFEQVDWPDQIKLPPNERGAFHDFIRPILTKKYSEVLAILLNRQDYSSANWLMNYFPLIDGKEYASEYMRPAVVHFNRLVDSIQADVFNAELIVDNKKLNYFMADLPAYLQPSGKKLIEALIEVYQTTYKSRQRDLVRFIERAGYSEFIESRQAEKASSNWESGLISAFVIIGISLLRACST